MKKPTLESLQNEVNELRAVCHAYDAAINAIPNDQQRVDFINSIPAKYREAMKKVTESI
jgi:hypothetical protein